LCPWAGLSAVYTCHARPSALFFSSTATAPTEIYPLSLHDALPIFQPVSEIAEILGDYPKVHFHVDATQSIAKVDMELDGPDTLRLSAHKFHGLKGAGALIAKQGGILHPVMYGGGHESGIRSGSVNLGAVAAMAKALRIATENKEENHERMAGYNERVRNAVSVLPSVHVQPGGAP